ncbi:YopX family protein [Enterococcus faecalis]|uniref:YopX family protein n=1 Tax=Enterococcus faecalis TaxID=1351 RepID=UPI0022DE99CA|nr:YopX family protein [Enterococcus faecalis]
MIPKFRAWDKRENTMRDVAVIHFTKGGKVNSIEYWKTPSELKSYHVRNLVLMQSTGLKDKNGVEIFEGDLVEHDDNINGTWETFEACEIVYDVDYAQFCFKNDASNFLSYYRNLCIIGNIHENPELLEGTE